MEDIIKTILDVVRVQHSATEGTNEKPFDMDDVVDMALGVIGRPESPSETATMTDTIQKMVESLAPDLFPPKTLEEMDDAQRVASVTSMLENRLLNGFTPRANQETQSVEESAPQPAAEFSGTRGGRGSSSGPPYAQAAAQRSADMQPEQESGDAGASSTPDLADFNLPPDQFQSIMDDLQAEGLTAGIDPRQTAQLNDMIYKNLMEVMGAQQPRVEFPFDRSQIRYGKEKSITEQLAEEEAEKQKQAQSYSRPNPSQPVTSAQPADQSAQEHNTAQEDKQAQTATSKTARPKVSAADLAQSLIEQEEPSQLSAWDLALNAVNKDEEKNKKEPYKPKPVEEPKTKSASQLAAEAIARAQEEDRMKLEIERQAEALMAEAQKRGQDPMKFALHQQEILRYMEKNSDELVSFEDYEDLSPEEKLEVERQIYIDKQIADGVDPDKVDTQVPEEYIPSELKTAPAAPEAGESPGNQAGGGMPPVMTEEMLRMLSQEVVRENAAMILAENADEDMSSLEEVIFQNLKKTMGQTGVPVPPEDVGDLIEQAITANRESQLGSAPAIESPAASASVTSGGGSEEARPGAGSPVGETSPQEEGMEQIVGTGGIKEIKEALETPKGNTEGETGKPEKGLSAVELARAAQKAAKVEPKPERKTVSAADIAREAQERALRAKLNPQPAGEGTATESTAAEAGLSGQATESTDAKNVSITNFADKATADSIDAVDKDDEKLMALDGTNPIAVDETGDDILMEEITITDIFSEDISSDDAMAAEAESDSEEDEDEYEYVDPDELVLGEHTQAEVDEALDNLATLGLEGEVYERAKRMLLLELAGSEAELDAWLREQEKKKTRSSAPVSAEDTIDDISKLDEDALEKELELALDEDFLGEDFLDEDEDESLEEEEQEKAEGQEEAEDEAESQKEAEDEAEGQEEAEDEAESQKEAEDEAESQKEAEDEAEGQEEAEDKAESYEETDGDEGENVEQLEEPVTEDIMEEEPAEDGIIDVEPLDTADEVIEIITESDEEEESEDIEVSDVHVAQGPSEDNSARETTSKDRSAHRKKVFRKREKAASKDMKDRFAESDIDRKAEEKSYQVSTRKPFVLKNSASFMDQFEDYITDTQENRRLSTGFKKLDAMLRYGLHKGSYFIDAQPQYLKNSFMQQIADRAAESGIDVLYISTELSRYDLMVETISRLSYEIHHGDPANAVSPMAIMTGEDGADLASLKDELNWYRGRISEHLFILDQESVSDYASSSEAESAGDVLIELISSIVREGAHKPVVVIDNIENILSTEDSEDMKPFMEGMKKLAKELGIPILMSYGYAQAESEEDLYPEEKEYHEHLGNMCDVYLELVYADMISEDMMPLTEEDVREMAQEGESLLINILIHKNRRPMKATLQIQGTPKYNFFEE